MFYLPIKKSIYVGESLPLAPATQACLPLPLLLGVPPLKPRFVIFIEMEKIRKAGSKNDRFTGQSANQKKASRIKVQKVLL